MLSWYYSHCGDSTATLTLPSNDSRESLVAAGRRGDPREREKVHGETLRTNQKLLPNFCSCPLKEWTTVCWKPELGNEAVNTDVVQGYQNRRKEDLGQRQVPLNTAMIMENL